MATCLQVKVPIARVLTDFRGLPRDSFVSRTSNPEKHLENISEFLFLSVLAAGLGNLRAT